MGAWGTGPLDNDTAGDFVDALKRAEKARRGAMLAATFSRYVAFDAVLKAGKNVVTPSEEDIAALRSSREDTLEANRGKLIPPAEALRLDAGLGGQAMRAVLENRLLARSWGPSWRALAERVQELAEGLEALASKAGRV